MRQMSKKISMASYLWLWCTAVFAVVAIVMLVVINYVVELAARDAVRRELSNQMRKVVRAVEEKDNQYYIGDTYVVGKTDCFVVIMEKDGTIIDGDLPEEFNKTIKSDVNTGIRTVVIGEDEFYVLDKRSRYYTGENEVKYFVRGIIHKSDVDTVYQAIEESIYVVLIIMALALILFGLYLRRRISRPMQEMCEQAEEIGENLNYSKRIEYEGYFQELDTLIVAYNQLLDKTEHLIMRQEQFNSDVSHELRTPVAVIQAQCQLTKEKHKDMLDAETVEAFDIIARQTDRMNSMIEVLLHLSRIDQNRTKMEFEQVDLVDIVESVCEDAEDISDGEHRFQCDLQEAIAVVDIGMVMLAIRNLVSNAMKYSPKGSVISVSSGCRGENVYVSIQDFGSGITREEQKKIFEYYYRAEKSRNSDGFGLGLTLAMKIANKHGGTIELDSCVGKGSTFTLVLPVKQD